MPQQYEQAHHKETAFGCFNGCCCIYLRLDVSEHAETL